MSSLIRFLVLLLSLSFLAACGSGGGSDDGGGKPPALSISGVTPAFVSVGDTVTVVGNGFSAVSAARLGTLDVAFTRESETRLHFVVPLNAISGTVTLVAGTTSVSSSTSVTVQGVPLVTAVNPASARPGDSLTLSEDRKSVV